MSIAAVIRELIAAGLSGDALVAAVERIELAQGVAPATGKAARNQRYYEKNKERLKAQRDQEATERRLEATETTEKRLKATETTEIQTVDVAPPKVPPHPPKLPPQDSPSGANAPSAPKGARSRGCRLPDDFAESPKARQVVAEWGYEGHAADEVLAEFCDFWRAVPGVRGTKTDWPATLRNRLREIGRRQPDRPPPGPGRRRQPPATTRDFWAQTARQAHETLTRKSDEQHQGGFEFEDGSPDAGEPGAGGHGGPVRERPRGELVQLPAHGDLGRRRAVG
ncbi:hypothetical protein [Methylobacterium frigidaeris]|uniref:hypothetical protein n=1 Tax=Methylobacterium frigidaeris TaxID=2038277 RepID=UPI001EE0F292|nr:hypothetical protein [Methylobacterium frigidaeris]